MGGKGRPSSPHPEDPEELRPSLRTSPYLPVSLSLSVKREGSSAVSEAVRVACPAVVSMGAALSDFLQSPLP